MTSPRFSILIPTRDRPDTFQHTLKTVMAQVGDDYEVIVADNCSGPRTKEIVDDWNSEKIKYIRSDAIIPMAENWENGLNECSGDYITILGDDDGLVPSSLSLARNVIDKTQAKIVSWALHTYWWPDTIVPWNRNRLYLEFGDNAVHMDKRNTLIAFYQGQISFGKLPMIYNSFIHKSCIEQVRQKFGRYFAIPHIPDVFSGVVNLTIDGDWYHVNRPMAVRGNSGKSNGTAQWARSLGEKQREQYLIEEKVKLENMIHETLVPSPNLQIIIANCKIKCKELIFPDDDELTVDIGMVISGIITSLNVEPEAYDDNLFDAKALADKYNLTIDPSKIPQHQPTHRQATSGPIGTKENTTGIAVNGDLADISDINGACRLADALMPPV
ncbi:MAG: glycosyltransferase [Gammaproteobacteria bacterium]|nr:glycosyltransferase [Gammaproteobacteria bacterium]